MQEAVIISAEKWLSNSIPELCKPRVPPTNHVFLEKAESSVDVKRAPTAECTLSHPSLELVAGPDGWKTDAINGG